MSLRCRVLLLALALPAAARAEADTGLVLDLDADVPFLDLDTLDFKFAGALTLGWRAETWGATAHGSIDAYDLTSDTEITDTTRSTAELTAVLALPLSTTWRLDGRLSGGTAYYDTTLITLRAGDNRLFAEESSLMLRGSLLAGALYSTPGFTIGGWFGFGMQHESYDLLAVDDRARVTAQEGSDTGTLLRARLRARVALIDQALGLRFRAALLRHHLSHASADLISGRRTVRSAAQIDANLLMDLDLEWIAVFGFVPSVNGGLIAVARDDRVSVVPLLGVGVRRLEL